jgi:hypothetical protein
LEMSKVARIELEQVCPFGPISMTRIARKGATVPLQ